MAGATIDHIIATTIFLAAMLIFISLFNQTIQTVIIYQRQKNLAIKCSDILDNILLNPGFPLEMEGDKPIEWGKRDDSPSVFGLQNPEFTQYRLSPFSLMRLQSSIGTPVYCTITNRTYSNITLGFGSYLLVSMNKTVSYDDAAKLLGIYGMYGFQLTLTPIVNVEIEEANAGDPLTLTIKVTGRGVPLAHAEVSYALLKVKEDSEGFPTYDMITGAVPADNMGVLNLNFSSVCTGDSYAFLAYAKAGGLIGFGCRQRPLGFDAFLVPLVESFNDRRVTVVRNFDLRNESSTVPFNFTASFMYVCEDLTIRRLEGYIYRGNITSIKPIVNFTVPKDAGILIISYKGYYGADAVYGITMMPWGINMMAFPVVFGGDISNSVWVATEIRSVLVGDISYEAKLAMWSLEGYEVIG